MNQTDMAKALLAQFNRALHMFRSGVEKFSEVDWYQGESPDRRPASLAYHLLEAVDFYAGDLPANQFPWGQRFGVDWESDDPALLPTQAQIKEYSKEVEQKLAAWLEEVDLTAPETLFKYTGRIVLERGMYSLRHAQHHVGELSRELELRGQKGPEWR